MCPPCCLDRSTYHCSFDRKVGWAHRSMIRSARSTEVRTEAVAAPFGDPHVDFVFGVVDVEDLRNDAGNVAARVYRRQRADHYQAVSVEITASINAVDDSVP